MSTPTADERAAALVTTAGVEGYGDRLVVCVADRDVCVCGQGLATRLAAHIVAAIATQIRAAEEAATAKEREKWRVACGVVARRPRGPR